MRLARLVTGPTEHIVALERDGYLLPLCPGRPMAIGATLVREASAPDPATVCRHCATRLATAPAASTGPGRVTSFGNFTFVFHPVPGGFALEHPSPLDNQPHRIPVKGDEAAAERAARAHAETLRQTGDCEARVAVRRDGPYAVHAYRPLRGIPNKGEIIDEGATLCGIAITRRDFYARDEHQRWPWSDAVTCGRCRSAVGVPPIAGRRGDGILRSRRVS